MKKQFTTLIILLAFIGGLNRVKAQSTCCNPDFSSGDFTCWTGSVGQHTSAGSGYSVETGMIVGALNQSPFDAGQQSIMTIAGTDVNTGNVLSVIPPTGGYSCMLGNAQYEDCTSFGYPEAAQLNYVINPVTTANCIFTYQYAVVLQNPGHGPLAQPKFTINVLNASGTQIGGACGTYTVTSASGLPGFTTYADNASGGSCSTGTDVEWKDWTTVTMDLSPWIGSTVTIQFTSYDCMPGSHFGYAYIQCHCGQLQCTQQCSGSSVTFTAPPGFASYQWTGGPATQSWTISPVPADGTIYSCLLTSVGGCTFTVQTTSTCNPQLTQQCLGDSVIVSAPSGFSSFLWNNGDTTQSIVVNSPVSGDTVSCICTSTSDTITLSAVVSTIPVTGLTADTVTICRGDTAIITASGVYTYLWNTGQTGSSIPVAPNFTTIYTVTATSSGGCTASATAMVKVNQLPKGTISSTSSSCTVPTGTITITPTAGAPPFIYIWNSVPTQTTPTDTGLFAGSYTVTITDSNGCSAAITGTVPSSVAINLSISSTNEHCGHGDGTATVTVSGGTAPYSYLWNTTPTTPTITSLSAGTYYVTVTDNGGCTATASVTITNLSGPVVQFTTVVNDSCGVNDGLADVNVTGGTAPYTFNWSNGETSNNLINVPAGNYCLTVTDANGCTGTNCVTIQSLPFAAPDICIVTVDTASNHCMVVWEKPITGSISKYDIYRETSIAGVYNLIGTQNYSNMSDYVDTSSNALQQSYRYELGINDTCGNTSQLSSYHQTIHLSINAGLSGEWNLIWNDYIGFTLTTYNIYRGTNESNITLLTSVSSSVTSYTDLTPPPGNIFYMVEAVRPSACNPSKAINSISSTISNIAKNQGSSITEFGSNNLIQISPNPGNGVFTLSLQYFTNQDLKIEIYNSLGQLIKTIPASGDKTFINISGFPSGVYIVKVKTEKGIVVNKFVKE